MFALGRRVDEADLAATVAALDKSLARIVFAPDGTVLEVNANFTAVTGYTAAEIVGRHHSVLIDPA